MGRKRKPRSRGQIQARGPEKYLVRVFLGTDGGGKRQYASKTIVGSKKDAERKLTEMLAQVDTDEFVQTSGLTVETFLRRWLDGKTDVSPSSLAAYRTRLEGDVIPYLGQMRLEDLNQMHIEHLYNQTLVGKGHSGVTIRKTNMVLKQALEMAVRWKLIKSNPTEDTRKPKADPKEIAVLTPEQVQTFLGRTSGTFYGSLWTLLLTTGLRPQEALCLRWEKDLDLDGQMLTVSRKLVRGEGGRWGVVSGAKTKAGVRKVKLAPGTVEDLRAHRTREAARMLSLGPSFDRSKGYVFSSESGGFLTPNYVYRRFMADLEKCGIEGEGLTLYSTRHTHATICLLNGVPVKVISERLGHASVVITMDTYSKVLPEMQEKAADEIEKAFFSNPQSKERVG